MEEAKKVVFEETRAKFFDRACAYFIDFFILYILISIISLAFPSSNEYKALLEKREDIYSTLMADESPSLELYLEDIAEVTYDISKETALLSIINIGLTFLYFGVCAYLCGGKTIGKHVMHLRVKSQDGDLKWWQMLIRPLLINSLLSSILAIVFLYTLNPYSYVITNEVIMLVDLLFVVVSGIMVLYSKKQIGLHDMITRTEVIKEVRKNG